MAIGDFNGDGLPDAAIIDSSPKGLGKNRNYSGRKIGNAWRRASDVSRKFPQR